jgi:hypothetical protein
MGTSGRCWGRTRRLALLTDDTTGRRVRATPGRHSNSGARGRQRRSDHAPTLGRRERRDQRGGIEASQTDTQASLFSRYFNAEGTKWQQRRAESYDGDGDGDGDGDVSE